MNSEKSLRKYWLVLAIVLIVAAIAIYFISKSNKIDYARVSKEMKDFASLEEPSIEKFVKKGYVDITKPLEHDATKWKCHSYYLSLKDKGFKSCL